jgi:hypothetical protein
LPPKVPPTPDIQRWRHLTTDVDPNVACAGSTIYLRNTAQKPAMKQP